MAQSFSLPITVNGYNSVNSGPNNNNLSPYDGWTSNNYNAGTSCGFLTFEISNNNTQCDFIIQDNTTAAPRSCFIHLFGNFNGTNSPDATYQVSQSENDTVSVTAINNVFPTAINSSHVFSQNLTINNNQQSGTISVKANPNDQFSNPAIANQQNTNLEILSIDFTADDGSNYPFTGNENILSTLDHTGTSQGPGQFLTINNDTSTNNEFLLQFNAEQNAAGNFQRHATIRFRHPTNPALEDTCKITQDIGYNSDIHRATISVQAPDPNQTFDSNNNPTVGVDSDDLPVVGAINDAAGEHPGDTLYDWTAANNAGYPLGSPYGNTQYLNKTILLENDGVNNLVVQYLCETIGSDGVTTVADFDNPNINAPSQAVIGEPIINLSNFVEDNLTNANSFTNFATLGVVNQPTTYPSTANVDSVGTGQDGDDYFHYNSINIGYNNTLGDRSFDITAKHPLNTTLSPDDTLTVVQKAAPVSWFEYNIPPDLTALTNQTEQSFALNTLTYLTPSQQIVFYQNTIAAGNSNIAVANYAYYNGGGASSETMVELEQGHLNLNNVPVICAGDKPPLVQVLQVAWYNHGWTIAGPGFESQQGGQFFNDAEYGSVPGDGGTGNSYVGTAAGGPQYNFNTNVFDMDLVPSLNQLSGVGSNVNPINYKLNINSTSQQYQNYLDNNQGAAMLDADHRCYVDISFQNTNPIKDIYYRFGIYHPDRVDYSTTAPQPLVPFDNLDPTTYPDAFLLVKQPLAPGADPLFGLSTGLEPYDLGQYIIAADYAQSYFQGATVTIPPNRVQSQTIGATVNGAPESLDYIEIDINSLQGMPSLGNNDVSVFFQTTWKFTDENLSQPEYGFPWVSSTNTGLDSNSDIQYMRDNFITGVGSYANYPTYPANDSIPPTQKGAWGNTPLFHTFNSNPIFPNFQNSQPNPGTAPGGAAPVSLLKSIHRSNGGFANSSGGLFFDFPGYSLSPGTSVVDSTPAGGKRTPVGTQTIQTAADYTVSDVTEIYSLHGGMNYSFNDVHNGTWQGPNGEFPEIFDMGDHTSTMPKTSFNFIDGTSGQILNNTGRIRIPRNDTNRHRAMRIFFVDNGDPNHKAYIDIIQSAWDYQNLPQGFTNSWSGTKMTNNIQSGPNAGIGVQNGN